MLKKNKGFTLIELLVVIAIIGILSSVVLASLNSARRKARDARRIADLKQIQIALEMYAGANNGNYPNSATWAALGTALAPTYIAVMPNDPLGGTNTYYYAALGSLTTCSSYHLGANLEETSNPAFSSDVDAATAGTVCTGSGADFVGKDVVSCGGAAGTDACYDLKP